MRTITIVLAAVGLALLAGGCSEAVAPDGTGELSILLVDAPGDFQAVNIAVKRVEAHLEADGKSRWEVVADQPGTYDLLTLCNGVSAVLAGATMPAGSYGQLRLLVGRGSHVVVDGQSHPLTIPGGSSSGIKLDHAFAIEPGRTCELIMDFDAARSIHRTGGGGYILAPVIRVMAAAASGSISGGVQPAFLAPKVMAIAGTDTIQTRADPTSGGFMLTPLPAGTYSVVVDASDMGLRPRTLTGVEVVAGQTTDVGTVTLGN